jgi:hypothetical protein
MCILKGDRKMIDLKREKVAVLCDTKDKVNKIYEIYGGRPMINPFECHNPSNLYIGWDNIFNGLTWDSFDDGYFVQCDYKLITFDEFMEDEKVREFKVGDRVKLIKDNWNNNLEGQIGIIVDVKNKEHEGGVGIEFNNFKSGHECKGNAKEGQGWYYPIENIEIILANNNSKSIHITFDNNTTHAVLKDGKDVIKRAKVGLYYEDEYKFETGVIEVVKKLLDIKEEEEVKPFVKAKVGDRIRIVNNNGEHYPEVNNGDIHKVVEVLEDGVITDENNAFWDDDDEYEIIESTKDLSDYTTDELLAEIRLRSVR